jgi:hypothetical protein
VVLELRTLNYLLLRDKVLLGVEVLLGSWGALHKVTFLVLLLLGDLALVVPIIVLYDLRLLLLCAGFQLRSELIHVLLVGKYRRFRGLRPLLKVRSLVLALMLVAAFDVVEIWVQALHLDRFHLSFNRSVRHVV